LEKRWEENSEGTAAETSGPGSRTANVTKRFFGMKEKKKLTLAGGVQENSKKEQGRLVSVTIVQNSQLGGVV